MSLVAIMLNSQPSQPEDPQEGDMVPQDKGEDTVTKKKKKKKKKKAASAAVTENGPEEEAPSQSNQNGQDNPGRLIMSCSIGESENDQDAYQSLILCSSLIATVQNRGIARISGVVSDHVPYLIIAVSIQEGNSCKLSMILASENRKV